jgi:hypothetical protein
MTIDNTQWANYEHRKAFDQVLTALRPYGYTDEAWGNDAGPKITLLGDAYHEHDINLFVGGEHDSKEGLFFLYQDHNFLYEMGCGHHSPFYAGDDINEVIRIAKLIAPAQETYTQLLQAGYRIENTGGGCTAWAKDFDGYTVMVTGDGQANLIEMDLDGGVYVDELVCIGVTDRDLCCVWGAGTDDEAMSWVRVGDHRGLAGSLEVAETVARENRSNQIDLISELGDFYSAMLKKHYPMGDMFSADDLLAEHGHEMSKAQRDLLQAFCTLWERVETLETKK